LYEVTKLRFLREAQQGTTHNEIGTVLHPDFMERSLLKPSEAERLTQLYLTRLDPYFYGHLEHYADLTSILKTSTILAICVCTVAALHDPDGSDVYEKLCTELRSVVSSTMFDSRLELEDIRALCIAAYWLCDFTWTLSSFSIRKAISLQYHKSHTTQPSGDRENFLRSQLWLLLYLCDEQISTLRGMPPSIAGKDYVKWENHMASEFATEADLRCVSHVDLLLILRRVRELFGDDPMKPIPPVLISQLRYFNEQVDLWGATWSGKLGEKPPS
jgi:hypothetical protein